MVASLLPRNGIGKIINNGEYVDMKKILIVLCILVLTISATACSQTNNSVKEEPTTIQLTKDNIDKYVKFDGSFVDGTYTMGTFGNWADAKLEFQTYPVQDGKFNNVEFTLIATSDNDTFTYMNSFGNYWHLEDAKEGEDKEIKFTVNLPLDGKFQKTYEVTCSNNTGELEGDCDFEIVSVSGEFKPNN